MELFDTRAREKVPLRPREPGRISIYACGPTVYSRIHVGNARPFVVFSLLKRYLQAQGLAVTLVCNITDINDKIYAAAGGSDSAALARRMTAAYIEDTDRLGLGRPDFEPLASESLPSIIEHIEALIARGHAYAAQGDVYFRVRSDPRYGELSRRDLAEIDQGEGIEGLERKENALDFALWKASKDGEDTSWDSPWGRGRPGWHIECSAMAESLLGLEIDIHGGGLDLLFPHHENEAAQTRCARRAELARLWMHNGMLQTPAGEKMAKSVGNISPLHEVLDEHGRDAVLIYFCSAHYRGPIAFGDGPLRQAAAAVERIRDAARRLAPGPSPEHLAVHRERFVAALDDDFNTAAALAAMWDWIREANRAEQVGGEDLRVMLDLLGLANLLARAEAPAAVAELAAARVTAREQGDWTRADELREEILARGWVVRDGAGGTFELVPA
ncbi:MAG: cysteine--tRNA ligase [Solirubrobacteraceae bacterium]